MKTEQEFQCTSCKGKVKIQLSEQTLQDMRNRCLCYFNLKEYTPNERNLLIENICQSCREGYDFLLGGCR